MSIPSALPKLPPEQPINYPHSLSPVTRTVHVTIEDIQRGERCQCDTCPVALAASRAFGEPVDVGALMWCGERKAVEIPPEVRVFIAAFDDGDTANIRPFSFEVTL